jgi:hypothetical protein
MGTRRQVTEEDIRMTEALIGRSYGRLKRSVARAPYRAFGSVSGTVRAHPLGAAAVAMVAGIALCGLFRLATRPKARSGREPGHRPDMTMELLRMVVPLVTPYVAGYLEKYMGKMFAGDKR